MDHFIRFFNIPAEDALYLRLCTTISRAWRCSHRARGCILYNQCIKENFDTVVTKALNLQDFQAAKQIIRVSRQMMAVKGDLWCNSINYARDHPIPNAECDRNDMISTLLNAYNYSGFQEDVATLKRVTNGPIPVYVDDSLSLIYSFFMPVSTECETSVSEVHRLGKFLLVFYDVKTPKTRIVWQKTIEARQFVTEYLNWGMINFPECMYTKSKRMAQWVVWLPDTMKSIMYDFVERSNLLRILDMDLKTILSFDSKDPGRICFQRFGITGISINSIVELLMTRISNVTLLSLILKTKPRTVFRASIPMIIVRGFLYGYYSPAEVCEWYETDRTCQCCFVEECCANKRILVLDSRAYDVLGRDPQRSGRLIKHNDNTLKKISTFELHHGEMLSRQGDHWVAYICLDSSDALLVAITLIHRYMRGTGLETEFDIQIAMNLLARCYLYWGPTDNATVSTIFHLMCYLILRKQLGDFMNSVLWLDLGSFIEFMSRNERLHPSLAEKMHAAVAKTSLFFLRMTIHGYGEGLNTVLGSEDDVKKLTKRISKLPRALSITPKGTVKHIHKTVSHV
uniref:Non-structural protein NS1 n=1 Tax=Lobuck virus TaxID=2800925 RepID=A0A894KPJ3_9VIRU|nr:MAG: Nsp1 [Lobuck virus]